MKSEVKDLKMLDNHKYKSHGKCLVLILQNKVYEFEKYIFKILVHIIILFGLRIL